MYPGAAIEAFFSDPANVTAFLGIWALVALGAAPFAWSWEDFPEWDTGRFRGGRPKFNGEALMLGLMWPMIPFAILCAPLILGALFLMLGVPHYAAKWWNADWSRRVTSRSVDDCASWSANAGNSGMK